MKKYFTFEYKSKPILHGRKLVAAKTLDDARLFVYNHCAWERMENKEHGPIHNYTILEHRAPLAYQLDSAGSLVYKEYKEVDLHFPQKEIPHFRKEED